jgi:hypothetical protein
LPRSMGGEGRGARGEGEFPNLGHLTARTLGVSTVEEWAVWHGKLVGDVIGDLCDADLCGTDVMVGSARMGVSVERVLWLRATAVVVRDE